MSVAAAHKFMQQDAPNAGAVKWLEETSRLHADTVPAWVQSMRATGAEVFAKTGLPTLKWEDWKYTNLRIFAKETFTLAEKTPWTVSGVPEGVVLGGAEVEGVEQYLVSVGNLAQEPFVALNAAYMRDVLVIKVPKGMVVQAPIEVLFDVKGSANAMYHPRIVYWLEEGAEVTIKERYTGAGSYFMNLYEVCVLEKNANLKLYRMQEESAEAYHVSSTLVQQHDNSSLELFAYAEGGLLAREEFKSEIVGRNVASSIQGVYLVRGKQTHDFKILTSHFEPHGTSAQYFRGAVDDTAQATFQGKIYVHRGAQKTDGAQMNKALLLSKHARTNFKPELEIYADDVKCSHGATSGQIDENVLFYMRNRGLSQQEAEKLLVQAFLSEAVDRVSEFYMQEILKGKIEAWLMQ